MGLDQPDQPGGIDLAAGSQAQLSEGTYEFTGDDNASIERAATSASIWSVCAMVGAALMATLAIVQFWLENLRGAILVVPLFLICAAAGWIYRDAGRSLEQVVTTEGNDVELLMRALERITRAFRIEVVVTAIAVLIFAALVVATRL